MDKCRFCGSEIEGQGIGWINYRCGSDWIDKTLSIAKGKRSDYCKLKEKHMKIVEAAKEAANIHADDLLNSFDAKAIYELRDVLKSEESEAKA